MTPKELLEQNLAFANDTDSNEIIKEYVESHFLCGTNDIVDNLQISKSRLLDRREEIEGVETQRLGTEVGPFVWYPTELREKAEAMGMRDSSE